jgi:hypothetical protein
VNLWAQSGLKARHVAILGGGLAVYDVVATSVLPLMDDLIARLGGLPFAPLVAWEAGGQRLGIGLGDLLMASVFPLVMRKAFGRRAGWMALASVLVVTAILLALLALGIVRVTLPAMVALGPLMVAQYVFWARRLGPERTTREYLEAEPLRSLPKRPSELSPTVS